MQRGKYQIAKYGIQAMISHQCSQRHKKEEMKKKRNRWFFKKHVKYSKTVNEKNEENAELISPQPQSSNDSTIDLTEESSFQAKLILSHISRLQLIIAF